MMDTFSVELHKPFRSLSFLFIVKLAKIWVQKKSLSLIERQSVFCTITPKILLSFQFSIAIDIFK